MNNPSTPLGVPAPLHTQKSGDRKKNSEKTKKYGDTFPRRWFIEKDISLEWRRVCTNNEKCKAVHCIKEQGGCRKMQ